jgi:hypothetical protein
VKAIRASQSRLLLFEVVKGKPSLKEPAYCMRHWIEINRAPVLTLWAAVVATRLGFEWEEALTLGRAMAGLNAYSKGKALGLFEPTPEAIKERRRQLHREKGALSIDLLNRRVPVVHTEAGIRALQKDQPTNPASVMNYLPRAFGDVLDDARDAMASLAGAREPQELASKSSVPQFHPASGDGAPTAALTSITFERSREMSDETWKSRNRRRMYTLSGHSR